MEVTATAPILQTENAVLGEVVATERIVNLPLNGRNFLQLSTLTPGVVVREESNGERTRVIANGSRDIWMQVNIGGITAVNNRANFVNFYPSVDAIQEFKVQSANYSAEYGGNAGANINDATAFRNQPIPWNTLRIFAQRQPRRTGLLPTRAPAQGCLTSQPVRGCDLGSRDPGQNLLHGQLRRHAVRHRTRRHSGGAYPGDAAWRFFGGLRRHHRSARR